MSLKELLYIRVSHDRKSHKVKELTHWEEMFTTHTTDKGLISLIYKETKDQNLNRKMGNKKT